MDTSKSSLDRQTTSTRKRSSTTRNSNAIFETTTGLLESYLHDCQQQPPSPASSSTSQTTGDTTFEPTIDMMVNDFDDEQTLTEEEALAEFEAEDTTDEIATLQKESEMPLEELLAYYRRQVEEEYQHKRQKRKKSIKKNHVRKQSKNQPSNLPVTATSSVFAYTTTDEVIVIDESDDEVKEMKTECLDKDVTDTSSVQDDREEEEVGDNENAEFVEEELETNSNIAAEFSKPSHLLELYPEKFPNIQQKLDDYLSEEDYDNDDLDYVKKTIMVGSAYQATVPVGLSKYGDVLPYENEDKLIWEPPQVSEQEVEDYLMRVREIKSSTLSSQEEEMPSSSGSVISESDQGTGSNSVKDDEQALHLLVQCGYNFKEALRRNRLNAVPLTGSMSLWSEEECRNFEEGIQKFGKDFRKIQQTQVRTRSIRELVQFYYLWKKTDRRVNDFIDSNTIDHMDIYLDFDERDTVSNGGGKHISIATECFIANQTLPTKKQQHGTASTLNHFSIMNDTKRLAACSNYKKKSSSKKHPHGPNNSALNQDTTYRRRCSLLSVNKTHHHRDNNNKFLSNSELDSASQTQGGKVWRNHNLNATAPSTISTIAANHCSKKL